MLFKPHMVKPILAGIKVESRRAWKRCIVRVGHVYTARTNYSKESVFALIKILYVRKERLGDINKQSIMREGYESIKQFMEDWINLYGSWDEDLTVYVIGFRLVRTI